MMFPVLERALLLAQATPTRAQFERRIHSALTGRRLSDSGELEPVRATLGCSACDRIVVERMVEGFEVEVEVEVEVEIDVKVVLLLLLDGQETVFSAELIEL